MKHKEKKPKPQVWKKVTICLTYEVKGNAEEFTKDVIDDYNFRDIDGFEGFRLHQDQSKNYSYYLLRAHK